jgi:hypothetical protein
MTLLSLKYNTFNNLTMLEFGDQLFNGNFPTSYEHFVKHNYTKTSTHMKPVKEYFQHIGMNHISIDINGLNGAIQYDTRQSIVPDIFTYSPTYDIITNSGFSEHVGEGDLEINLWDNQYAIWKNFHDVGKIGSVYIHLVPRHGHWLRHGVCDYDLQFFRDIVHYNNYDIFLAPMYYQRYAYVDKNLILVMYAKQTMHPFMTLETFRNISGLTSTYYQYYSTCIFTMTYNNTKIIFSEDISKISSIDYDMMSNQELQQEYIVMYKIQIFCSKHIPFDIDPEGYNSCVDQGIYLCNSQTKTPDLR